MPNTDILLSIVIVSWNSCRQTVECLESLYIDTLKDPLKNRTEVIVIDNNSHDNTVKDIQKKFPEIVLIKNQTNKGYAPACNQGMRIAKGKFTLLLGSDTVIKQNALRLCVEYLESHFDCGAVGCKLFYTDGSHQGNCKKFPTLRNAFFTYLSLDKLNYQYDLKWFDYDKTIEVDQIATTFLMIRSDILKEINYFDERFRIMYNDVDLCRSIWNTGNKIIFLHTAEVFHHGSFSTNRADFKVRKIMYEDIFLYYYSNYKLKAVFLLPVLALRLMLVSIFK